MMNSPRNAHSNLLVESGAVLALAMSLCACGPGGSASNSGNAGSTTAALGGTAQEQSAIAKILTIEDHRLLANPTLQSDLESTDAVVAAAAVTAVGRIGDATFGPQATALLNAHDSRVRAAAAGALESLGAQSAEAPLLARLATEQTVSVRVALLDAIGHVGTATSLPAVAASLNGKTSVDEQSAAAEALAILIADGVTATTDATTFDTLIALSAKSPDTTAAPAAYALRQLGAAAAPYEHALEAALAASPSVDARISLLHPLAKIATATSIAAVVHSAASDPVAAVRAEAASVLYRAGATPIVLAALAKALADPNDAIAVSAAGSITTLGAGATSLAPQLEARYDASAANVALQTALLPAIVATDPSGAEPRAQAALSGALPLQLAAIAGLGTLATPTALTSLTNLIVSSTPQLACQAMSYLSSVPAASITPAMQANATQALAASPSNFEVVQGVAFLAANFGWTSFAPSFDSSYPLLRGDANMNGRINALWALGYMGSSADLKTIDLGLADDQRLVALQAAGSYQQLTGMDVSGKVPLESIVVATTPTPTEIATALNALVLLETTRGTIILRMLPTAPLNATNFVKLAASGFYDGLTFPRVIPNYITQGGDPLGDGYGSAPHFVRDELSQTPHKRGTVGLGSEGKDTGSCQFFINTRWNLNLDGLYTVFAEVESGLDVADALEEGDTIEAAFVLYDAATAQQ